MKDVKKRKRLIVQIGTITGLFFLVLVLINVSVVYSSTVDLYLEAKNEMMSKEVERVGSYVNVLRRDSWFIDYWEEHAEQVRSCNREEYPDEKKSIIADYIYGDETVTRETLDGLSDEDKLILAATYYDLEGLSFTLEKQENDYDDLFCIDISEKNRGFVLYSYSGKVSIDDVGENRVLGQKKEIDLDDHPALRKLVNGDETGIVFERVRDFPVEGDHYVGYKPLYENGKVRAVIGISYNWSEFRNVLRGKLRRMAAAGLGSVVLVAAVMMLFMFRRVIKPLTKVQKGVREYMADKDSEKAAGQMSKIKERNEVGVLAEDIAEMTLEIQRYTKENLRLNGERERIAAELELGARIQSSMLSKTFPESERFEVFAHMTPAKEVGGDFYDVFLIDDDHLGLVIADVSGKGVPAALFMMMAKGLIRNYAMRGDMPAEVLEHANAEICANNEEQMFVTVWFGVLEVSTGRITAANAGHEYPIIKQPDGSFELFKDKHGFVLGGIMNKKYKQYELTLQKGGTLFVYTDGAPEATAANEEMFGTQRLVDTLNAQADGSPQQLISRVYDEVGKFVGDAPQFDDLTMLAITIK